jgi:adenine phosphoribosyltransferase
LGAGFVAIRKAGALFPGKKVRQQTGPDYRGTVHYLEVQERALDGTDRVLLVDDWVEKGSQALAAKSIIEQGGATLVGLAVVVDQLTDEQRGRLGDVHSIVRASELPSDA